MKNYNDDTSDSDEEFAKKLQLKSKSKIVLDDNKEKDKSVSNTSKYSNVKSQDKVNTSEKPEVIEIVSDEEQNEVEQKGDPSNFNRTENRTQKLEDISNENDFYKSK